MGMRNCTIGVVAASLLIGCTSPEGPDSFWRVPDGAIYITMDGTPPEDVAVDAERLRVLSASRERLQNLQPLWTVGALDGPEQGRWAFPVSAVTDSDGTTYVLDRFLTQMRIFSPDGDFLGNALRAGDGPLEIHTPTGMTLLRGDTLVVYSAHRSQLLVNGATGIEHVRDLSPGPSISALCQAASHILTRVTPERRAGTLRVIDPLGQEIDRYGSAFDHELDHVSAFFSMGGMACSGSFVVTFFNDMPLLYGYDVRQGTEAWSAFLTGFSFPDVRLDEGGGVGRSYENASDMVVGLFGLPDESFLLQVNRMGPQEVQDGRSFRSVERRDTYILLAESGVGIHVGAGLPHIIGVSANTLQALESEPVPKVTNYAW